MANSIIVYSTPLCAPCERLKQYLRSNQVQFDSRDLMMDEEAAEKIEDLGIRSTPVLEVDGQFYSGAGLSPDNLSRILGLA
jgi:glutaredoxin-like protein NrdH